MQRSARPGVVVLALLISTVFAPGVMAQGETALPAVQFGLVGLSRFQSARLNTVNTSPENHTVPPSPCDVTLRFLDASGAAVLDRAGNPVARMARLLPGQSLSLELRPADFFAVSTARRRILRASVEVQPGPPTLPPGPCAGLVHTLELVDTLTQRTTQVYTNPGPPTVASNPGPPDVFGLVGIARLQSAALRVLAAPVDRTAPPNPCDVTLKFLDGTGALLLGADGNPVESRMSLLPGESATLTLRSADAFSRSTALRKLFRASVEVQPGPPNLPPNQCSLINTLELFDDLTGYTLLIVSAGSQPGPPN